MRLVRYVVLMVLALVMGGCAQNIVPLVYTPAGSEVIPMAGAPVVSVVQFADTRKSTDIGKRSDDTAFIAGSSVSEWVTTSLAAELTRIGYLVTVAGTEELAKQSGAKYIVTGSVEEVWLTEHSSASYDAVMRVNMTLKGAKGGVVRNTFNSSISRKVVPMASVPKTILSETITDLVRPMSLFIQQKSGL